MGSQHFLGNCIDCGTEAQVRFDERPPTDRYDGSDKLGDVELGYCDQCGPKSDIELHSYEGYN